MGCSWTVMLETTTESPLDWKEIQPANPKGNQSWIFVGKTDAEAETPILWLPHGKELTHLKRPWCWERLKTGGERDNRGWDGLDGITNLTDMSLSKLRELVMGREAWRAAVHGVAVHGVGHDWVTELNWTLILVVLISGHVFFFLFAFSKRPFISDHS